ncbi:uncharacterized protein LOC133731040 [Rosa rugosa]|uniref:uncharacterized protein LOC133731040 n=1 Tax=Rosa rugosa TaxID=74645 RepID=UPI002B417700|nr:uncharacterized protein LOC133731040 [Rosa rugosa]
MENIELANEVESITGALRQDQAYDQSIPPPKRVSRKAQWQASMSSKERDNYLTRRRANYHCHREQTSNCEDNIHVRKRVHLSHIWQMSDSGANQNATNATNSDDDVAVNEGTSENVVPQNDRSYNSGVAQVCRRQRRRKPHNCARNFHENIGIKKYHLPPPKTCPYCHARLFHHETKDMCCLNGKTVIPPIQSPPEMVELFSAETPQGAHFRQNIRAYNHVFSFTSMGVHIDQSLATGGSTFTFRAQGSIYHKIGSLLPDEDNRPRFLQLYIYDTDHEVDNRMLENEALHRDVVENIQQILNRHNPFVHVFHHLARCQDLETCKLIIREQPANQLQYSLPSESQVAAIIVGVDDVENLKGRDIMVQTRQGQLLNVQDCAGYYDHLQYPLLLPYGTYGWDVNSRNNNGQKLTCRDYYAYILQVNKLFFILLL